MPYIRTQYRTNLAATQDDTMASKRFVLENKPELDLFYEFEPAIVLDVILNETHPAFKGNTLNPETWPPNIDGSFPKVGDPDYSWIGRIKFRYMVSEMGADKNTLNWAIPLENTGITEYPLMNEVVSVVEYEGQPYYTRKLNIKSTINANADFNLERVTGLVDENIDEYKGQPYPGPKSQTDSLGAPKNVGVLGDYFKFNPNIRALLRREGDTVLESRFGSSMRFGAYDNNRSHDNGIGDYADGGGNPYTVIRNRQAPAKDAGKSAYTAKGYVWEDINADGSSIHMLSGKTISEFVTTVKKVMISGVSQAPTPVFDGDQILINSDRLVFSSKANEMLCFAKKRMSFVTDDEITIDAKKKITITSEASVSINAPKIYLGRHAMETQPVLKGRTTCLWLSSLCDWMMLNVNSQIEVLATLIVFANTHTHIGNLGRPTGPAPVSMPPMAPLIILWEKQLAGLEAALISLEALKAEIDANMSSRVFGA